MFADRPDSPARWRERASRAVAQAVAGQAPRRPDGRHGTRNLFGAGPLNWLLGPLISGNLNPAKARARITGAEADSQAALASFDGTVLIALEETETALSNYARALDRRTALRAAVDQAGVAARITRAQQREGQTP